MAPRPHEGIKEVYFETGVGRDHDVRHFTEAPNGSDAAGSYQFGPVQVRHPGATEWTAVPGTTDRNVVLGPR